MRTLASLAVLLLALTSSLTTAAEPDVRREILGLRLDMTKEEVETRLKEIGKFVRDERKQQQVWEAKDKSFSHVIVGYEKAGPGLRYVTAVAREDKDSERIRYSDVGKLEAARQAGDPKIKNFNYEWTLPPIVGHPEMLVIARGRDPEFLSTVSLKRIGGGEEDDDEGKDKGKAAAPPAAKP